MTEADVEMGLKQVGKLFQSFLEPEAQSVIGEAISGVKQSRERYENDQSDHDWWGVRIYQERPLRFTSPTENRGADLFVDMFCDIRWRDDELPFSQDICIRVWSNDDEYVYRDEWDSERVLERLVEEKEAMERVMMRLHFDRAEAEQPGPEHHLQFGGNSSSEEIHWFPENIRLPRIKHMPMDLVLACQLIAANFYPRQYAENVQDDVVWEGAVKNSQNKMARGYYEHCLGLIQEGGNLIDNLWGI